MDFQQKMAIMTASEYKKFQEAFMQNHHGTSAQHVFLCILFTVLCSVYASLRLRYCKSYRYFYEYIIIVLPLILVHTVMAPYIYHFNVGITAMLLDEILIYGFFGGRNRGDKKKEDKKRAEKKKETLQKNEKIYSISIMRGLTYLITVFAILAVDFKDFPRYLAKTERYGYSLMDTGVGLFVLMSGLVHRNLQNNRLRDIIIGNFKLISILVILGIARYYSIKQLDYQVHVTEYGVHWNFFFTLAICKLLSTAILYFDINHYFSSFTLLMLHEFILASGVKDFVFSNASRDSFISANREGLSSCLGYVCLYLFGAHIRFILNGPSNSVHINFFNINTDSTEMQLLFMTLSQWTLLYTFLGRISRTLANIQYCVYLEAILVTIVCLLHFIEKIQKVDKYHLQVPKIIEIINANGLSYFLIANLLTGGINLSIRTLAQSSFTTFIILNVYMIVTLLITVLIKKMGIKI